MRKKNFSKNSVIHLTLLVFVILSAFLMTIGSCVIMQTSSSMENIFSIAKPPHFLQMHTGDLDKGKIEEFANSQDSITHYEVVEMVNIGGADIWYKREGEKSIPLAESMLDNGFVRQTKNFDYLLDLKNNIVKQEDGKIGVPITYMQKYDMSIGDTITIKKGSFSKTYTINCFLRDAQMASSMASSVRFLLSDHDFMELKEQEKEVEYIVEFRLKDSKQAGEIQKSYEASGLPANGQGVTYPLIKLVNGLSSGLLAGAMILISIILILIAAWNLYFTISAVLEEEIREIGAMKAIGISNKDIKKMYLKKYCMLAALGCVIGFVIGMCTNRMFTKDIRLLLGDQSLGMTGILVSTLGVLFVYWFIMALCKKILKRIGKITVVQALVYGDTGTARKKEKCLAPAETYCRKRVNLFLSLKNLLQQKKSWLLVVVVFFLATNVMLIPMNLMHTLQDKEFANSMGNPECDVLMQMQVEDDMEEKCEELRVALDKDKRIKNYSVFSTNRCETKGTDEMENIQIQWGDYREAPIHCIQGRSPQKEGEIALSYLNQGKLGKNVGDHMEIIVGNEKKDYKVTGIYQDITSGGYTAKAYHDTDEVSMVQSYTIFVNCKEKNTAGKIADAYGKQYSFAKILPAEEYTKQTFGSITDSFGNVAYVSIVVALFIGILITVLFLKLQMAKEYSEVATLRVLGFTLSDITKQYMIKAGVASFIGILLGILWCNTGCEKMVGLVLSISNFGIGDFEFIVQPVFNFALCPLLLLAIALVTTYLSVREIREHEIVKMLQE